MQVHKERIMVPLRRLERGQEALLNKRTKLLSKTGSIDASQLEKFLGRSFSEPKKQRFHYSYLNLDVHVLESYICYGLFAIHRWMQSWRASFLFVCSIPFTILTEDWKKPKVHNDCSFPFLTHFDTYSWRDIFVSPFFTPVDGHVRWMVILLVLLFRIQYVRNYRCLAVCLF